MPRCILVMDSDANPTQWRAVAQAPTCDQLRALQCYNAPALIFFAKDQCPGTSMGRIQKPECRAMDIPHWGTLYEINC
jgi:hypothetical protein